jgi:mannosyl-3-phosphoglycerate phosphatase
LKKLIIFTDLDGTLLDAHTYSFKGAISAIKLLRERDIPLIISSSKTRPEIELYRRKLKNTHPFISENGGGIFIPKGYFKLRVKGKLKIKEEGGYLIIILGTPYPDLRKTIKRLQSEGFKIKGFGDMTIGEVASLTGLKPLEARLAKERDFDEPFVFIGDTNKLMALKTRVKAMGLNITQGEFFHLMGNTNKGRAVDILKDLYMRQFGEVMTIGVGDSLNDVEMLRRVDYPVIVKRHDGGYDKRIRVRNLIKADGIGPEGWGRAIMEMADRLTKWKL